MAFYLLFFCGIFGGVLGGMGMGGGTLLIPLLTVLCGIDQGVAQGLNLLSFLPMSLLALSVHQKSGLLKIKGAISLAIPATVVSVFAALAATYLPSKLLKFAFGSFLIVLSFFQFSLVKSRARARTEKNK